MKLTSIHKQQYDHCITVGYLEFIYKVLKNTHVYRRGQNCWYPSFKEGKTHNCHWNNLKLTSSSFVSSVQRTFSQKPCGLSICILANSCFVFIWFAFNSGVLLGRLWLKQRLMVRSGTDVPRPWSSPLISLKVVLGTLVTICIIRLFNLSSIFLLQPRPGRLATVPWTLNFWIICATVVTGISSCLEMVL